MIDKNILNTKNDIREILGIVNEQLDHVIANEIEGRLKEENRSSGRAAIDDLLRQMESLSHLNMQVMPGTQDEQIKQRGKTALIIKDLLLGVAEVKKGTKARSGSSPFSQDLLKAIFYGSEIYNAIKREEQTLYQFLPVAEPQPAPVKADVPRDENGFELVDISSRSGK